MNKYTPIDQLPSIIETLHDAFNLGLTKDIKFRKQQLTQLSQFCKDNDKVIKEALWKDLRKHSIEGETAEISPIVDECNYMIRNLDTFVKPIYTSKRFLMHTLDKTYIRKEPKGVVLVIGAWNYPVLLLLMPVVGAIAAGNTVVIKPSEVSQHTAEVMATLLPKYLDQRAYRVITGGVPETTAILKNRFDHIFYTGNGQVGKIIMAAAATHLTPVTLELGGKSPAFITPDADIDVTAHRLIWGKFYNTGQTCVSPDYALVTRENVEPLIAAIRNVIQQFYGQYPQRSDSYGRIVNHRQFDRLKSLLDNCDPKSIVIGGETDRDDLYIAPTVVYPVDHLTHDLMQQEIFGPILPIIPVDNMKHAIDIVNDKEIPLSLYVFTNRKSEYEYILDNTRSGGVCVNDTLMHLEELSLPFGGVGPSGMGNYHGVKSFDTFTHERSTMVKDVLTESMVAVKYPPYNNNKAIVLNFMVYGLPSGILSKWKTMANVCSAYYKYLFDKSTDTQTDI